MPTPAQPHSVWRGSVPIGSISTLEMALESSQVRHHLPGVSLPNHRRDESPEPGLRADVDEVNASRSIRHRFDRKADDHRECAVLEAQPECAIVLDRGAGAKT